MDHGDVASTRRRRGFSRRLPIAAGAIVLIATAVVAFTRVGLFDLPSAPLGLAAEAAGLADLDRMRDLDRMVRGAESGDAEGGEAGPADTVAGDGAAGSPLSAAATAVRDGRQAILRARVAGATAPDGSPALLPSSSAAPPPAVDEAVVAAGLGQMRQGVRQAPTDLVLANAYRMTVFSLRRDFLRLAHARGVLAPQFPPHLDRQPIAFFEELVREHPSREARLHLALAWVDEMLLFPALEIKAPASVQAVDVLTQVLEEPGSEWYVPALFARGLNHLHRPARLVWPESNKTAPDAAAQDIARCVAAGRRLGVGSQRLQATLAMTLGDAYVKAGRFNVARSWWQIALNLSSDADLREAVHRRFGWRDENILDRLEEELDRARAELEHPMTDLALMWD